jgi:hypothetical protein
MSLFVIDSLEVIDVNRDDRRPIGTLSARRSSNGR